MAETPEFKEGEEGEVGKGKIFERIVYDFVCDCRYTLKINDISAFCNLVEFFFTNLVYTDKKTDKDFKELQKSWNSMKMRNDMTQGPKSDIEALRFDYAMRKYRIIAELLKSKNLFPKPAEYERW